MKYVINKLSALFIMLMCVSATVQAAIVHHGVCQPTLTSRGFTRECWENTETGKIYADAACTQEITDEALAKAIIYPKLPKSPVKYLNGFGYPEDTNYRDVNMNYSVSTSFGRGERTEGRYAEFRVTGDNVANARLVLYGKNWYDENNHFRESIYVDINVNNVHKRRFELKPGREYVFVQSLPELNKGDVVMLTIANDFITGILCACLEYTGTFDDSSPIVYHGIQKSTENTPFYTRECWENRTTGKFYTNAACTQELKDLDLAKAVIYAKLPANPITSTNGFDQSEKETDWDVDLNWAAVTTYAPGYHYRFPRMVDFTASTHENKYYAVANARLVWNKRGGDAIEDGRYNINIYVNDVVQYSITQDDRADLEGVFVVPLLTLKPNDIVRFEVIQLTKTAYSYKGGATFKACLEYNVVPCTHEYPAGSAICSICDYVKAHDHTYNETEKCSQCGYIDPSYIVMSGYVGKENLNDIKWELNRYNVLTFTGHGEMELYNADHNAWKNNYKDLVTKIVFGEGITNVGDGIPHITPGLYNYFGNMAGLTQVVLPSTLKSISNYAFEYCKNLTSITFSEGLETIGNYAFWLCYNLSTIVIPASVKTIGVCAFYRAENLRVVTLNGAPTTIGAYAFGDLKRLSDFCLMSPNPVSIADDVFIINYESNLRNATLHVNNDLYDWARSNNPWKGFGTIVPLNAFNVKYTDAENNMRGKYYDKEASNNTWTLSDGAFKNLTIDEDIPMQTLTYTRNFSAVNTWQALYVPFEMEYSDWADKFDVAAISNFHEYTNENGVTEKIDLEARYVKSGKLRANTPYLIRAKEAGEQTIVLNNVTLKATEPKSIDCSSTERRYTFTGTYDAIDGLQTKNYIFISGGRLSKSNNNTDVLKPMRWYLTIEDYFSVTGSPAPALAKPMRIHLIDDDEATGIIQIENGERNNSTDIYNLNGMRLTKPQKGINIINGKKIVVK